MSRARHASSRLRAGDNPNAIVSLMGGSKDGRPAKRQEGLLDYHKYRSQINAAHRFERTSGGIQRHFMVLRVIW